MAKIKRNIIFDKNYFRKNVLKKNKNEGRTIFFHSNYPLSMCMIAGRRRKIKIKKKS
jgi:hypothetical protein